MTRLMRNIDTNQVPLNPLPRPLRTNEKSPHQAGFFHFINPILSRILPANLVQQIGMTVE